MPLPTLVSLPPVDGPDYDVQLQRTLVALFKQLNTTINQISAATSTFGTGAPTSGAHAPPEFVWNSAPGELGLPGSIYIILGWSCITAGTPGSWRECRVLTGG